MIEHKLNDDLYYEKLEEDVIVYFSANEYKRYTVEFRRDPITGLYNIINKEIGKKPREYPQESFSVKECVFCNIEKTPVFKDGKRYEMGNSILIPNKYPYYKNHFLLIPNYKEHIERISDIKFSDFFTSFLLLKEYLKIYENNFIFINLNKGLYAGASQPHIHFQILVSDFPTNYFRIVIEKSSEYNRKYRKILLEDYANFEKKIGDRFIYESNYLYLFASYSPFRNNEITGIINSFGIFFMDNNSFEKFLKDLYKILLAYEKLYDNFNMTIYDTSFVRKSGLLPMIRIGQRNKYDIGYMEALNLENVISSVPEETAEELRKIIR